MFASSRTRILDAADLVVDFATLGEYRLPAVAGVGGERNPATVPTRPRLPQPAASRRVEQRRRLAAAASARCGGGRADVTTPRARALAP